jgi:hypothetical protein
MGTGISSNDDDDNDDDDDDIIIIIINHSPFNLRMPHFGKERILNET